ncbi:MAG: hypothetical protein V1926_06080 [Candidatus Peregrinibacteria bacterium]
MSRFSIVIVLSVLIASSVAGAKLLALVSPEEPSLLIDDRDVLGRFNTLGQRWTVVEGGGYGGSYHLHSHTQWRNQWASASWTFVDVPAGVYEVFVTWPAIVEHQAPRLELRVADAKDELLVHAFAQDALPNGPVENGVPWQSFGTVTVTYGQRVMVAIRARNRETYTADAVLLKPVAPLLEFSVSSASSASRASAEPRGDAGSVSSTSSLPFSSSISSKPSLLRLLRWPFRAQKPPSRR